MTIDEQTRASPLTHESGEVRPSSRATDFGIGLPPPPPVVVPSPPVTWGPGTLVGALRTAGAWTLLLLLSAGLICYPVGPLFASREQVARTDELRLAVGQAYGAAHDSLEGADPVTRAPAPGSTVALLQLPRLAAQQAVAEGATSQITRGGVSHVPGTAGPGQPGNAVFVGRRSAFGGPFGGLADVHVGDQIICITTQGQTSYVVTQVTRGTVSDAVYNPSDGDQLTLVTSDSVLPWNTTSGVVVTGQLQSAPFVPTPQNGYAPETDGRHGDASAWPLVVLELLVLGGVVTATMVLYRRWSRSMTFVVTTPALVALTIFTSLTASRLLPGWF
ncbi:MAG: sortase [Lapillicoccus sp.]